MHKLKEDGAHRPLFGGAYQAISNGLMQKITECTNLRLSRLML